MGPHNPYRNYDKGMDDAYTGREPQSNSAQYMQGYEYADYLLSREDEEQQEQYEEPEQDLPF